MKISGAWSPEILGHLLRKFLRIKIKRAEALFIFIRKMFKLIHCIEETKLNIMHHFQQNKRMHYKNKLKSAYLFYLGFLTWGKYFVLPFFLLDLPFFASSFFISLNKKKPKSANAARLHIMTII